MWDALGAFLSNPTVLGVIIFGVLIGVWFLRDVRNPERTASNSVLLGFAGHTAQIFAMSQEALKQSQEAQRLAAASAQSNLRCEQRITAFVRYTRTLTEQLVDAGITPAPMPAELADL